VRDYLSDDGVRRYAYHLGDTGGQQKVGVLYKPGVVTA
jgi:hypothetical protein